MNINLTGTTFTDYHLANVGASAFGLAHDWFTRQDLVIRTAAAGGGTLLVEGTDYTLDTESLDLSERVSAAVGSGRNVFREVAIINATYQTGNLYLSGKYVADSVEAIDHEARLVAAKSGANYTILDDDDIGVLEVNPSGADRTVTLPTVADNLHRELTIVNSAAQATAFKVIVEGEGAEQVGQATAYWLWPGEAVSIKSNGTLWRVISPPYWHHVPNPSLNWIASKAAGWTADSFSGGLSIDFAALDPNYQPGARKARLFVYISSGSVASPYARANGDANISNTPNATKEYANQLFSDPPANGAAINYGHQVVIPLSVAGVAQIAVTDVNNDLFVSYPMEYLA